MFDECFINNEKKMSLKNDDFFIKENVVFVLKYFIYNYIYK